LPKIHHWNYGLQELLKQQEGKYLEFKSSMLYDKKTKCINNRLALAIIKSIASFSNSEGGILLVGVDPHRNVVGLENDFGVLTKDKNIDGWLQYLSNLINNNLEKLVFKSLDTQPLQENNKTVAKITIGKHFHPIFVKYLDESGQQKEQFYIRGINGKQLLSPSEVPQYVQSHWDRII
jgi:predicted HTH transcriptional regulator